MLVTGESGIGKSRLLAEALAGVGQVATGAAVPVTGPAIAYGLWLRVLRELTAADPLELLGSDSDTSGGLRFATTRAARLDRCFVAIETAARRRPLAIVLEDLQWADEASLELLAFVVRRLDPVQLGPAVLIVATSRFEDGAAAVGPLLTELQRQHNVHRVHLEPLPRAELGKLVATVLVDRAADQVVADGSGRRDDADPAAAVDRILADCGGNTFLATELAMTSTRDGVPRHLSDIMLARLSGLPTSATAGLHALAVLGRPATHHELERIVSAAGRGPLPGDGLRHAVNRNLLAVTPGDAADEYAFRHGLMAGLIRNDLMPGDRTAWHRAIAEALSTGDLRAATSAAEVAEHAYRSGDPARALRTAVVAGREAIAVVAPGEAHRHLSRAVDLWPRVEHPERVAALARWELFALTAGAARWCGDLPGAIALVEEALRDGPPDDGAASLLERLGRFRYESGDSAAAGTCYRRARELLGHGPPSTLSVQIAAAAASLELLAGHHRRAVTAAHRAAADAERVGAPAQQAYALTMAGVSESELGLAERSIADLRRAAALAVESGDIESLLRAESGLCVALDRLGRLRDALAAARRALAITTRFQLGGNLGQIALANTVDLLRMLGSWSEAVDLVESAPEDSTAGQHRSFLLVMRALVNVPRGRFDAVDDDLAAAAALVDRSPQPAIAVPMWNCAAELLVWRAAPADAWEVTVLALDALAGMEEPQLVAWTCALGMRAIADDERRHRRDRAGHVDRAGRARRLLEAAPVDGEVGLGPQGSAWVATLHAESGRYRGDIAPEAWSGAADRWRALERPYDEAYALYRLAEAYAGARDRRRAGEALSRSLSLAESLGADPLVRDLRALAQRTRLAGASAADSALDRSREASGGGLTARETEVLGMLAEGMSNRQIARRLFISEKTVSVHVSNLLAKLQASTRTEAAWLAQQRGLLGHAADRSRDAPVRH